MCDLWLVIRPPFLFAGISLSQWLASFVILYLHFTHELVSSLFPRRAVLSCLIHMSAQISIHPQYKYQPPIFFHTLSLSSSSARKDWPSAMRIPRPSLIPRLLLLAIITTVAAAVPLLFWSRRYALISSTEEKVHSSSSKAKDCLKRESLALHSHSSLFSVTARHVGCASWPIITCKLRQSTRDAMSTTAMPAAATFTVMSCRVWAPPVFLLVGPSIIRNCLRMNGWRRKMIRNSASTCEGTVALED